MARRYKAEESREFEVTFKRQDARRIEAHAARAGVSPAEWVRRALEADLDRPTAEDYRRLERRLVRLEKRLMALSKRAG